MRDRITPARIVGAAALIVVLVLVAVPVLLKPALPAKAVEFLQVGHWVFNDALRTAFHVHGGSKQVDAKIALPDVSDGGAVLQGASRGYVVNGTSVVSFGKSNLRVDGVIPIGIAEQPLHLEVPGGPYLVYRGAGSVVRLGLPSATIAVGGPVAGAVALDDGTVWLRRADTGQLCSLAATGHQVRCAVQAPAGAAATLTVVGEHAALLDATTGTLSLVRGDVLTPPVRVMPALTTGAEIAANDAGGRLPVLDPTTHTLLLVDTAWAAHGHRRVAPSVTVKLGVGRYRTPIATGESVAVLDLTRSRLLTFGHNGAARTSAPVAAPAAAARLSRGGDGKVYVDDAGGAHTIVMDADGLVTNVKITGTGVPTAPVRRPPTATTTPRQATANPPRPAGGTGVRDGTGSAGRRGGGRTTPPARPGAPTVVTGRPGNAQVTVSWRAAPANGAQISGYEVGWLAAGGGAPGGTLSVAGGSRTAVVPGLHNGTAYVFTVIARNRVGPGPAGTSTPVTPSSDVPSAPAGVTATSGTDSTVTVGWQPADGQGHTVTGYEVTALGDDGSSGVVARPTTTSVTLDGGGGITGGVTYTFTVTATNELALASAPSAPSNAVAAYGPADAPGGLTATVDDGTVTLTWDEPALAGGRLVEYVVSGDGVAQRAVTERSTRFEGLSNGRGYAFSVRAVTRGRAPSGSATVDGARATVSATPGTVPGVELLAVDLVGDRAVAVRVRVDERSSGGVTCQLIFNGAERWRGGCSGTQDITVGGLDHGTHYHVQVQVSNAFGTGRISDSKGTRTNDAPTVSVGRGAAHSTSKCAAPDCAWVTVSLRHFPANADVSVVCRSSGSPGGYFTYTMRTDGGGSATVNSRWCYFGYPRQDVWVTANGVESNKHHW